jgi:hypothetical protein
MSEEDQPNAEVSASTRSTTCPFCKESVRIGATKCPHCQASIQEPPDHGGECPFCREEINVEAVRCRHCKSDLDKSPPVKASVHPFTITVRATSVGCSECGLAARPGMQLFAARSRAVGPGTREYCFEWCPTDCPAGPECTCTEICVTLPDRGDPVAVLV